MQQNLFALRAVLDRIDGDSFETLEGRITFQKRVYLVQVAGLDLGYTFVWHHYGPYSSELAEDGLLLETGLVDSGQITEPLRFTRSAENAISRFEHLSSPPDGIGEPTWLELLSSLHYLAGASGVEKVDESDEPELTSRLLSAKPYFEDCRTAIQQAFERLTQPESQTFATAS